jgi:hypothetical protein
VPKDNAELLKELQESRRHLEASKEIILELASCIRSKLPADVWPPVVVSLAEMSRKMCIKKSSTNSSIFDEVCTEMKTRIDKEPDPPSGDKVLVFDGRFEEFVERFGPPDAEHMPATLSALKQVAQEQIVPRVVEDCDCDHCREKMKVMDDALVGRRVRVKEQAKGSDSLYKNFVGSIADPPTDQE